MRQKIHIQVRLFRCITLVLLDSDFAMCTDHLKDDGNTDVKFCTHQLLAFYYGKKQSRYCQRKQF